MKTIIEKTWLPVFNGFYSTCFEPNEEAEIEYINEEREKNDLPALGWDDMDFNYDLYKHEVCINATEFIEGLLKELGIVNYIKFEKLVSPREYNFSNDSIDIEVELIPSKLSEYINNNFENFEKYIKDNYSCYDGFISHYSNDSKEWKNDTENFSVFSNTHQLGALLDFICKNEFENPSDCVIDMFEYVSERVTLEVNDYEYECTKVKCPICGEYYSIKDHIKEYESQKENELKIMKELGVKDPKFKGFEKWAKENNYHHKCDE